MTNMILFVLVYAAALSFLCWLMKKNHIRFTNVHEASAFVLMSFIPVLNVAAVVSILIIAFIIAPTAEKVGPKFKKLVTYLTGTKESNDDHL